MKILILHRVPYARIEYARGIDHVAHDVTYLGTKPLLDTLPSDMRCRAVLRPGQGSVYDEAVSWLANEAHSFDRIISMSEYELLDAAKLRERFCVEGQTVHSVQLVRDKVAMKNAVAQAGIKVPRYLRLPAFLDTPEFVRWSGPTVLKPHSGASSEDVVVFGSPAELRAAVNTRTSGVTSLDNGQHDAQYYEVEEFVAGDVLHFDGLVVNGKLATATVSRYVGTCLGFARGEPLGSYHFPLRPELRSWTTQVLNAVDIRNGSFHLEAIETLSGLTFLEIGNRVGGADVVATFELATGVHLPSEELRLLIGETPSRPLPLTRTSSVWHGWFVFPGHNLGSTNYSGIGGIEAFRADAVLVRWAELEVGAPLLSRVTYSAHEAPLAGIIACHHETATAEWLRSLFASANRAIVTSRAA